MVFVPGRPFQPSLIFWIRPVAYLRVEHPKSASLSYATVLPVNIRLGWKDLPGTNTLAYCKNL
jgi:hypothetical protein